jgi:hypothetical protein
MPRSAGVAPVADGVVKSAGIVVRCCDCIGAAGCDPCVCAGVNQQVLNDNVTPLRQGREDGDVSGVTAAEEQRAIGLEESGSLRLQRFMLWMIAAEQARSAGADGDTALKRAGGGGVEPL